MMLDPLAPTPIVYPHPKLSPRQGKGKRDAAHFQSLLPLFGMSLGQSENTDSGQLLRVLWEVVRPTADVDGLLVTTGDGDSPIVSRVAFGFCPKNRGSDPVELASRWVSKTGQPLVFSQGRWLAPEIGRALKQRGLSSVVGLPLIGEGKKLGAVIALRAIPNPHFTGEQIKLLYSLCRQMAIALRHIQLIEELRKQRGRVEWLQEHSLAAQESERQRICLDLHDGVAQWIIAASSRLQTFDQYLRANSDAALKLQELEDMLGHSLQELRWVMADLQPTPVEEMGLPLALLQMISKLSKATGIHSHLNLTGKLRGLSPSHRVTIYRIVQEALNNIRKHTSAQEVTVSLGFANKELKVMVEDNGQGFDMARVTARVERGEKLGLAGMRERAETLGGSLHIWSQTGQGTQVCVRLPLGDMATVAKEGAHVSN